MTKLVFFTRKGCGPCEGLKMRIYGYDSNPPIEFIEGDDRLDLLAKYNVIEYPTILLFDSNDSIVKRTNGLDIPDLESFYRWLSI